MFSQPPKFVLDVLTKIFEGIHDKEIDTRSHNKASEIEAYFEGLPTILHPSIKPGEPVPFREAEVVDAEQRTRQKKGPPSASASISKGKTTKTKGLRSTLAPPRHAFVQPTTAKGQALVREASRLRLSDTPLSAAFVLRAFLQHTLEKYMADEGMPTKEPNSKGITLDLDLSQKA